MMADESGEKSSPTVEPRKFKLGITQDTLATQKGRVTRLSNSTFGTSYLFDVTDRKDPDLKEDSTIKDNYRNLEKYNNTFCSNNGVVAVITDKLDLQGRKRVYVGISTVDVDDPQRREIISHTLHPEGFQSKSFYVPFSFDSSLVRKYMKQEIIEATQDTNDPTLFNDFQPPTLKSAFSL